MKTRARPLYTCGKSALATANRAYVKVQDSVILKGAFPKLLEKLVCVARLVFCMLQRHCLAVLLAVDSWILSMEAAIERSFPPLVHVFDKVDELVRISESFPERSEGLLTLIVSWLEMSVSAIARWESRSASEKEIRVDTGLDNGPQSPEHTKGATERIRHTSGPRLTDTETIFEDAHEEGPDNGTNEETDKGKDGLTTGEDQTRDSDKEKDEETYKKKKDGGKSKRGKKKG
ncbi:hypothetical protein MLD38_040302 [Melastoma candidum]|uniref:Uncharacterized protein n=1 Tax=Melastoma candidum TaxID=119954 RepID=A0ACB9L5Z9_9MYRT|nr:hypothetical protein MLD38_040302 [Melastoma candidum]